MVSFDVRHGDCLELMRAMPDNSVDAVVTDPPYGLSFMGKKWDYDVPSVAIWAECLRVLKPGGHLLAFAGTRTHHRMAVRIEDAGFEIRDMIAWVYGSGFPKSLDVSKAIDKAAGEIRPRVAGGQGGANAILGARKCGEAISGEAISGEAQQWAGWGTALKPALEPITMARKPLTGTVAANVLEWGTGAINVDGCRVEGAIGPTYQTGGNGKVGSGGVYEGGYRGKWSSADPHPESVRHHASGRWPANLIHDGSDEVVGMFPQTTSGDLNKVNGKRKMEFGMGAREGIGHKGDTGSAARFFYCAKASKADRDEGCEGLEERKVRRYGEQAQGPSPQQTPRTSVNQRNHHPTVKPTDLMRYLCRLVTPPGGTVLDPFTGSGSTGKAAILEGFRFIGIEREAEYVEIAKARIQAAEPAQLTIFST
jgi:DNA modification methylase